MSSRLEIFFSNGRRARPAPALSERAYCSASQTWLGPIDTAALYCQRFVSFVTFSKVPVDRPSNATHATHFPADLSKDLLFRSPAATAASAAAALFLERGRIRCAPS
jgi:hypothetical protein